MTKDSGNELALLLEEDLLTLRSEFEKSQLQQYKLERRIAKLEQYIRSQQQEGAHKDNPWSKRDL